LRVCLLESVFLSEAPTMTPNGSAIKLVNVAERLEAVTIKALVF